MTEPTSQVCGLPLADLPACLTPTVAVVMLAGTNEHGHPCFYVGSTDGVSTSEALMMVDRGRVDLMLRLQAEQEALPDEELRDPDRFMNEGARGES